jgi:F0F1-type ATP synthase gamma subunit
VDDAARNTERMLDSLVALQRRERQGQITREVLELIGARFAIE